MRLALVCCPLENVRDAVRRRHDGVRLVVVSVYLALGDHMGAEPGEQGGVRRLGRKGGGGRGRRRDICGLGQPGLGAVGGGGIGEALRLSIGQGHEAKTLAIILLLLSTVIAVDQFSAWLRQKLVGDQAFQSVT